MHRSSARCLRTLLAPPILFGIGLASGHSLLHADAPGHREARGWLQLERDQRAYRERAEPLSLRERRQLETIERSQRDELRELERRQRRRSRIEQRLPPRPPEGLGADRPVRRRDAFPETRRALERRRLEIQMEQYRLPYAPKVPIR